MRVTMITLCFLGGCLPSLLFKGLSWRHWGWTYLVCPALCMVMEILQLSRDGTVVAFGVLLAICTAMNIWQKAPAWGILCWGGGMSCVNCALLMSNCFTDNSICVAAAALSLTLGGAIGLFLRWFSLRPFPGYLELSKDRHVTPLPLLLALEGMSFLSVMLWRMPILGGFFVLVCQAVILLVLRLWRDTAAAVDYSREDSSVQRSRVAEIEYVDKHTLAELQREISRFRVTFEEIADAYDAGNDRRLRALLQRVTQPREGMRFCELPLLNTLLLRTCDMLEQVGWETDVRLDVRDFDGLVGADVGVLLDLIARLLVDAIPKEKPHTMRLRMQEQSGVLVIAAGCSGQLLELPREKWEAIRSAVEEQEGWCEWAETAYGVRLNVVLYKHFSAEE